MANERALKKLMDKLGYHFNDIGLLQLALTHRSFSAKNNERLEFLGDAILNFVVGEELFSRFPEAKEGQLSRLRSKLVKGETLAVLGRYFQLGDYLSLGSGELKSGGFRRESILADAMEAIMGAIYLDTGMETVRERVLSWLESEFKTLTLVDTNKDSKTRLQEYLQSKNYELPMYEVVKIDGEPHDRTFFVACEVLSLKVKAEGKGTSRRMAEKMAAEKALKKLGLSDNE